ncbi:saccharopine dehydrogenase NADP-binding domain-containing protein [Inquilinus sp. Marseille-Q2685]|uniref:saccharopine dehydrogenase NADP-binding domain-containing protein n=1 Tax=Inquilinus sp. Marseille-Q2685 TaxID=2866581 RepID=UPI001CE4906B|nr:saccharopine dehydrogenase NADP-binding domain-containing protein [Inquilinus sp. Marseille-Q2685]
MVQRVLIAGGYGVVGGTVARYLRRAAPDLEIILAGRSPESGAALAREIGAATQRLDVADPAAALADLGPVDLIVAALQDRGDALIQAAMAQGAAHIGITKVVEETGPAVFAALHAPPRRPVVLAGHWAAGVLILAARPAIVDFDRIDSVAMAALYDAADSVGPMSAADAASFSGRALLRRAGQWAWVEAGDHARTLRLAEGLEATVQPLAALDVPSLAAITGAPDVRFDFGEGDSIGTRAGGRASHEGLIEIDGVLRSGQRARRRILVSDPKGVDHMTALGAVVIAERVLGLDGQPLPAGGLALPETLVAPEAAIARFEQLGVRITVEMEAA